MGEHVRGFVNINIESENTNSETTVVIVISGQTDPQKKEEFLQGILDLAGRCGLGVNEL
jgi:hypothetical protein